MSEELRIGLYICHCGLNIAGVVSPEDLVSRAGQLPDVVVCRHHLYTCSEAGQKEIAADLREAGLNRVVVAACSPKMHELTFQRLLQEEGLNPHLLEIVNLREHCTWVHAHEPEAATHKALELIRMGLAKVRLARPLQDRRVPVTRHALVIGGGPAGLKAAWEIAAAGHQVTLVERQPVLGGMAAFLSRTFPYGRRAATLIGPLLAAVATHPRIRVLTDSDLLEAGGHLGNFRVRLRRRLSPVGPSCQSCGTCVAACPVSVADERQAGLSPRRAIYLPPAHLFPPGAVVDRQACTLCGACAAACPQGAIRLEGQDQEEELTVGAMVVATGASPYDPVHGSEARWPVSRRVITTLALERLLAEDGPTGGRPVPPGLEADPRDIAFVLCVGSREEEGFRACSRLCCPTALKQALELARLLPQARIRVYYRDIRTPKKDWETLYEQAREAGVLFLRGTVTELVVGPDDCLVLRAQNELGDSATEDRLDLAVLAVGLRQEAGVALKEILKLPVGEDGFFLEAHPKLKPLETVLDGIFLAGTCQGPKDLAETFTQATAAAAKVLKLFAHEAITLPGLVAEVDPEVCVGCGLCVQECPFQAIILAGEGKAARAQVITAACKGCGICAGACPTGAVTALGFTDAMLLGQIDAALEQNPESKILAFCCSWCSYAGADFAGVARLAYPPNVRIIRTMCAGRVHPRLLLHALEKGAGRVLVSGCHPPGDCHYVAGNLRAQDRVAKLKAKLPAKGIDPRRLHLEWISATEGRVFQQVITDLAAELAKEAS